MRTRRTVPGVVLVILLVSPLIASRIAWGACTPLGGLNNGCVPPDKLTARCEVKFADHTLRLLGSLLKCHVKQADRPNVAVEEACELAAQASFDKRVASLFAQRACPACLTGAGASVGAGIEAFVETTSGEVFCDGNQPFPDSDNTGFLPPTGFAYTAERYFARAGYAFAKAIGRCVSRAAMYGAVGRAFDQAACEAEVFARIAGRDVSFLESHIHVPACVQSTPINASLHGFFGSTVDAVAYCAPTS